MTKKVKMAKMVKKANMNTTFKTGNMVEMTTIAEIAMTADTAKIAGSEIVIFFKTFKVWVFFEKEKWVLRKEIEFQSKSLN